MRKILFLLLITLSISAQSQVLITLLLGDKINSDGLEFGLEGGMNWTQVSGFETTDYGKKWNLGFYFDIRIKNQLSLYTGVLVKSNMGVDNFTKNDLMKLDAYIYKDQSGAETEGKYSHKMNYFLVPVLFKYKFKNQIHIAAGPQFGLMYKSWIEFNSDIDGKEAVIKDYNTDKINKIDAGVVAGLGYRLLKGKGWTISTKYYYGFVNVYKNISNTKNRAFFIEVCIPIGAAKKTNKINN